ncbi:MAG: DNA primase [Desulfobulbaceae bacterium]|nr:DNA primase [Desulfobulbaceae bacterium]
MVTTSSRENVVHEIKELADIIEIIGEYVSLRRSGANFKGLCPFHSEKTPSFIVNPDRRSFHCFGCGEHGDVFTFLQKYHNLTFPEAIEELARRCRITLPEKPYSKEDQAKAEKRDKLHKANEKASEIYHDILLNNPAGKAAREYIQERGMTPEIISSYCLGFAPESWDFLIKEFRQAGIALETAKEAGLIVPKDRGGHYDRFRKRILFPIYGLTGRIVGFGGRILGKGQPKYLNSPETLVFDKSRTLFGLYQNRESIRKKKECIIVEGNFDLLTLVAYGIGNVAAPLGTALTRFHLHTLKRYTDKAVLLFDGDSAGLKAALRAVPLFLSEQITAQIAVLPDNHDPDTFVREYGNDGLLKLLESAFSLPEFVFDRLEKKHGLTVQGKGRILAELKPMINAISDRHMQRTLFVSHFAQKLGLTQEQFSGGLQPAPAPNELKKKGTAEGKIQIPLKQRKVLEFLLDCPEYIKRFLDAGMEEIMTDSLCRTLIDNLKRPDHDTSTPGPERLLELFPPGPERTFLSGLLVSLPTFPDDVKEAMAEEMEAWFKKNSLMKKRGQLTRKINEAQQAHNETLWMELIEKKKLLDETQA